MRRLTRRGPVFIANKLGMHASTVGRVLRRYGTPLLRELDPVTGTVIRATRESARRYEHEVERLSRTLATEWAYAQAWTSNLDRAAALPTWLDYYNPDRRHLGIGGKTPIDRINNGRGQYS